MNLQEFSEFKSLANSLANLQRAGRMRSTPASSPTAPEKVQSRANPPTRLPDEVSPKSKGQEQLENLPQQAPTTADAADQKSSLAQSSAAYTLSPGKPLSDQLTALLATLCARAGLSGALLADANGLPLATQSCDAEITAACGALLGQALEQTNRILRGAEAFNLILEFEDSRKLSVRRFLADNTFFYLVSTYLASELERNELDLAITQLVRALGAPGSSTTLPK